jgi:hypothetical protein
MTVATQEVSNAPLHRVWKTAVTLTIGAAVLLLGCAASSLSPTGKGGVVGASYDHLISASTVTTYSDPPLSRYLQDTDLVCQVTVFEIVNDATNGVTDSADFYECQVVLGTTLDSVRFTLELPESLAAEQKALVLDDSQDVFYVKIPNGSVDLTQASIVVPDANAISLISPPHGLAPPGRRLAAPTGTISAVVIRITDNSRSSPSFSASELYQSHFGNQVSLKWQYHKCSAGKLRIEPAPVAILDVTVNRRAASSNSQQMVQAAEQEALNVLRTRHGRSHSSLRDYAGITIFVTPPMGNWLAYASIGGGLSVYNDKWGGYIASIMHEVGHNFKLLHANERGEYQDHTGYMSGAVLGYHDAQHFPEMCFNGANHWALGWYSDKTQSVSLNNLQQPTLLSIAPFVDYQRVPGGYPVVVQIPEMNYYLQYNRAKSFNADTYEYADHVTITLQQNSATELVEAISPSDTPKFEANYGSQKVTIQICSAVAGSGNTPEHMLVSVGLNGASACNSGGGGGGGVGAPDIFTPNQDNEVCGLQSGAKCTSDGQCCSKRCRTSWDPAYNICSHDTTNPFAIDRQDVLDALNLGGSDRSRTRGGNVRSLRLQNVESTSN